MKFNGFRLFAAMGVATLLMLAAHWFGLWPKLGGHPYWSASATYLGLALGGILTLVSAYALGRFPRQLRYHIGLFVLLAVAGIVVSTLGKADFVASYAEDRAAGKLWYFGFIAFIGGGFSTIVSAVSFIRRPHI